MTRTRFPRRVFSITVMGDFLPGMSSNYSGQHASMTRAGWGRGFWARRLLGVSAPAQASSTQPPRDFRELLLALTGTDLRRCPRCAGPMIRLPLPQPDAAAALSLSCSEPPDTS
jgi:hypothetical protein